MARTGALYLGGQMLGARHLIRGETWRWPRDMNSQSTLSSMPTMPDVPIHPHLSEPGELERLISCQPLFRARGRNDNL